MTEKNHRGLAGILFCIAALFAFALQDVLIKTLSVGYPVLQILSIRTILVLLLLVIIGFMARGASILRTKNPYPMLARGVFAFFAFYSYYLALTMIPLADAAAVYMTAPLFVTALSVPLLREKVGIHRWSAVCVGFLAVIIMLQPGSSLFQGAAAIPMFSAMCYAIIPILTRSIGTSQHPLTMTIITTFSYLLCCLIASAAIYLFPVNDDVQGLLLAMTSEWRSLSGFDFSLIALSGGVFTVGLLCITQAYRIANVSVVAPFEYSYLVWATLLGFVFFNDIPGIRTILGGIVVVACGLYILYREQRRKTT